MAFLLVDILPLKPGRTVEEAIAYFESLKPAFERHGLTRHDAPLKIQKVMRGTVAADMVNLFETENPEVTMKGLSNDPDYQAKTALRDAIFDLENASIIMTSRA